MVSVILQSSSWQKGLRVSYPSHAMEDNTESPNKPRKTTDDAKKKEDDSSYGTTPFRELIKTMPGSIITVIVVIPYFQSWYIDLAMVVLDKCRKEYDSGEREYNYEFIEDFPDLYMDGKRPKFNSGT